MAQQQKPAKPDQPGQVGHVTDPETKQQVPVVPHKGESDQDATKRVQRKHS